MKNLLFVLVFLGMLSCDNTLTEKEKQEYTNKGNEISQATFKALSEKLTEQMKLGGPAQAIPDSYTHLTLPTKYSVEASVAVVELTK